MGAHALIRLFPLLVAGIHLLMPRAACVNDGDASASIARPKKALSLPPQPSPEADASELTRRFTRSSALGVTHCRLKGVLNGEEVNLNIWLRMAMPQVRQGYSGHNATIKGFAWLEGKNSLPPHGASPQLSHAASLPYFSDRIYIRSPYTRQRYDLKLSSPWHPPPKGPVSQSGWRRLQGHAAAAGKNSKTGGKTAGKTGEKHWLNSHVIEIKGNVELRPEDVNAIDFELRAVGFSWHCPLVVDPPSFPLHNPEQGWKHHDRSTTSDKTQTVFLLSPYHNVNITVYAHLLWHHMAWHEPLGINTYILYADGYLTPLMSHPLVQAMVEAGRLHVIFFEMPKHEDTPLQPSHVDEYLYQIIVYNHALLSLWGSDSLVVVADVDEYILTPKPMTAVEMFKSCPAHPAPITSPLQAALQVSRLLAFCAPGDPECTPSKPYWPLFLSATPAAVAAGFTPHPLTHLTMAVNNVTLGPQDTKAMMDPNLVREMHVHFVSATGGSHVGWSGQHCARLLHLWDLFRTRGRLIAVHPENRTQVDNWWWNVKALQAA